MDARLRRSTNSSLHHHQYLKKIYLNGGKVEQGSIGSSLFFLLLVLVYCFSTSFSTCFLFNLLGLGSDDGDCLDNIGVRDIIESEQ
jgi:hypothetical protein